MTRAIPTQPTLCLAMIVRDEETNLLEWLPRVRQYLDELVVVDTGSIDGTVPLLLSMDAKVLEQAWAHDFAMHRNYGLQHVKADWVLILDADERLDETGWQMIRKLIENPTLLAYAFKIKNYHSQSDLSSFDIMHSYRLFRNGHSIQYSGLVHNQLAESINAAAVASGLSVEPAPLTIEHFGYALSEQGMRAKQHRIYSMVKKQLRLTPDDAYYQHHLLNICLAMGNFAEAKATCKRLDFERLRPELRVQAYYKAAQVAMEESAFKESRSYVHKALQITPNASFLHYLRSNIAYQMHRYNEGIRSAYKALELANTESEEGKTLHLPLDECYYNVGMGYLLLGEYDNALELLNKALTYNPHNTMALQYIEWLASHQEKKPLTQKPVSQPAAQQV
ncbi:MAG: tetratricopeptide repeat protein [Bacteroidota bacterium]